MADAVTERMQQAFGRILRGIGLSPAPTAVAFRKTLSFLDSDKLPLIVVAVGTAAEFEAIGVGSAADKLLWGVRRAVQVALAFASNAGVSDNPDLRTWHDAIWGAVNARNLQRNGLAEANDVNPRLQWLFDPAAVKSSTIDWSVLDPWTVETLEERTR